MKHRYKNLDRAVQRIRKQQRLLELYEKLCTELREERNLMARLASDIPQFSNPIDVWEAKQLRDKILGRVPPEIPPSKPERKSSNKK